MPNPYVNKVVQSNGTTLIDISDTTAVAADVASGKYFYLASGEKVAGTSSGGGASNIVTGTFKGTAKGAMDVNLNYSGSGYPIAVMIFPEEGTAVGNGSYYPTVMRGAVMWYLIIKAVANVAPTYTGGNNDITTYQYRNKSSSSDATSTSVGGGVTNTNLYNDISAASGLAKLVRIRSKDKISVYIIDSAGNSNGGFMPNIDYRYVVLYSS